MSLALARVPRRLLPLVLPRRLSSSAPAGAPLSLRGSGIRAQQTWKRRPSASAAATTEPFEQGAEQRPSAFAAATAEPVDDAEQLGFTVREKIQRAAEFVIDNRTYTRAQIMAAYFPKHPSTETEHEIRERMLNMVSVGLATIEVTLKLSGSLFMYGGPSRGAYTKNNFGNMCTAVGVFMLARIFREAWGKDAPRMQAEFNDFLEVKEMCISMELITTILGDHGQRPNNDYAVVTAIVEFGDGKPNFYSTAELIAFCQKWRLPTNHFWLFSTRKSAASFFAACDAFSEEGTATPLCKSLNEIADIVVPGSQDHAVVHGEIVEGLVARIVTRESSAQMEEVLRDISQSPTDDIDEKDLGPTT